MKSDHVTSMDEGDGDMIVRSGLESLLREVTGKVRLESEDPLWTRLFQQTQKDASSLSSQEQMRRRRRGGGGGWGRGREEEGVDMAALAVRLRVHNPFTGNLLQLLDHSAGHLRQCLGHLQR